MSNKVQINVGANLDTADIERQVNALGQRIAQANRVQFNPVKVGSVEQLQKILQSFEQMRRINGDLNKRINVTGQGNAHLWNLDYDRIYADPNVRARQMRRHFEYVVGQGAFSTLPGGAPGGQGGGGSGGGNGGGGRRPNTGFGPQVVQPVVNAALGQVPGGGVVAGAMGAGASAGFGAGLMGLLGGMAALGVGKAIGAVMDGVAAAEQNAIAMDKLKRIIGDVGVGFDQLKTVVRGGADSARVMYSDAARLTEGFVKAGNVKSGEYPTLGSELALGVGLSRSFGLDPDKGMGALGAVRGVGFTGNTSESRRFAALIGEAVGKSNAFAKADEVMDAISGFVVSQTRSGLGRANAEGYAGAFASLVSSGIPGMDPTGAAALLGRVNASLTSGGAKGEASQFFSAMVGKRMGLDPLQTQILREGGAFATNNDSFGPGSIADKFGISGPAGTQTWLAGSLAELRRQYGGNKGMLAQATANHLGVSMRQAMAMLMMDPKQMGELGKDFDLTQMNDTAIGNLAKVRYGSAADRDSVRQSLMGRQDVSADDKARIAGGDQKALEEVVAKYGQQNTQGSDIRDSKVALENIKVSLADKALPLFQAMRDGIILMAGSGKKSANEIAMEVAKLDYQDRETGLKGGFEGKRRAVVEAFEAKVEERNALARELRDRGSIMPGDERQAKIKRLRELSDGLAQGQVDMQQRIIDLNKEEEEALKKLRKERDLEIEGIKKANEERALGATPAGAETTGSIVPASFGGGGGAGAGRGSGYDLRRTDYGPVDPKRKDAAMKYFMEQGWTREQSAGIVANLWAESKMRERAVGDGGQAVGIAQWHPDRQAEFKRVFGKDLSSATFEEQLQFVQHEMTKGKEQAAGRALRGARTAGQAGAIVSSKYERPYLDEGASRGALAEKIAAGTPMPDEQSSSAAAPGSGGVLTGQIEIIQRSTQNGPETGPRQVVPVKIKPNGRPVPAIAH